MRPHSHTHAQHAPTAGKSVGVRLCMWSRLYWNLKNVTEILYGIHVRVLSAASWFHWSGMLLVSYYDNSGCKNAAGRYPMTHK